MKKIENTIINFLIIFGLIISLYLTIYVMLICGIKQIINYKNIYDIVIGILRIVFCEIGFVPFGLNLIIAKIIKEI